MSHTCPDCGDELEKSTAKVLDMDNDAKYRKAVYVCMDCEYTHYPEDFTLL